MFDINDKVRVITNKDKRTIKEGIVVAMTSSGARVYDPFCELPFSDNMQFAEWFPFASKEVKIMPFGKKPKK